ncbi:transcription termination factor Rho, partial [Singulisphaera rosea]
MAELSCSGVLEMHPKGYGFLRDPARNFKAGTNDVYVGAPMLAKFRLRQGVRLTGRAAPPSKGEAMRLAELTEIEGCEPERYIGLRGF